MSTSAASSGATLPARWRRALGGALGVLFLVLPGAASPLIAQTAAAPPSAVQPPSKPKPSEATEPVISSNAVSVLGKKVIGPKGENLGLVVDLLVDQSGQPQAAVIDFGGFLGVGSRKIAIDWKLLDFSQLEHKGTVELGLDRADITSAPEYKPDKPQGSSVVTVPPPPDATQKNP